MSTTICYIGGGSKAWAKKFMGDLLQQKDVDGELRLYDIDQEAAEKNKKYFEKLIDNNRVNSRWECQVYTDIDLSLKGADFVVISILPGTFDEMEIDVHLPEQYGVYQSVGDTIGPGGFNRALRTIPIYRDFARRIKENCPSAWVINYTNPMTISIATLYKEFPEIKAFGCCHEVFSTQLLLREIYQRYVDNETQIDRRDIRVNVQGINHFTWISEAKYKDIDLLPLYKKFADEYWEKGYHSEKNRSKPEQDRYFTYNERVKLDLFRRFGVIAAAGDRHLAEFVPTSYLNSKEQVEEMGFYITPVNFRKEDCKRKIDKTTLQIEGKESVKLEISDEEGVDQIRALLGHHVLITNVNLPNYGQLPDLPLGAVVETNAVFSGDAVKPILAGKMDSNVKALVIEHLINQQNLIEAYFRQDKQSLFETFYNDPAVKRLNKETAKDMFVELIDGTKQYLESWVVEGDLI